MIKKDKKRRESCNLQCCHLTIIQLIPNIFWGQNISVPEYQPQNGQSEEVSHENIVSCEPSLLKSFPIAMALYLNVRLYRSYSIIALKEKTKQKQFPFIIVSSSTLEDFGDLYILASLHLYSNTVHPSCLLKIISNLLLKLDLDDKNYKVFKMCCLLSVVDVVIIIW